MQKLQTLAMAFAACNSNLIFGIPGITVTRSSHASFMHIHIILKPHWNCCRFYPDFLFDCSEAGDAKVMHVGTHIVHPCPFDFWTSEDHWVSYYLSDTYVLELIIPFFVVDVVIRFFDVRGSLSCGAPPCSSNFTSGLACATYRIPESVLLPL